MNNLIGFKNISLYSLNGLRSGKSLVRRRTFEMLKCKEFYYDRFKKFNNVFFSDKINWKYNLDGKCKKTFEEICIDRVNEFYNKYDKIILCVSGGISSVTILSAFALANCLDKLIVIFDQDIIENKSILIDWFKKNNIEMVNCKEEDFIDKIKNILKIYPNSVITNGKCGDQISHGISSIDLKRFGQFDPNVDYNYYFEFSRFDLLKEWIEKYPFKEDIKTLHHLTWLVNFSVCWMYQETIFMFLYKQLPPSIHKAFFATQEFTDWAINNLDIILSGKPWEGDIYYKPHFKEVIRKVFGNQFDRCSKLESLNVLWNLDMEKIAQNDNIFATDGQKFYTLDFIEK